MRCDALGLQREVLPAHVGHGPVGDDQVIFARVDPAEAGGAPIGQIDVMAIGAQVLRNDLADNSLVVDHEDTQRAPGRAGSGRGRLVSKRPL